MNHFQAFLKSLERGNNLVTLESISTGYSILFGKKIKKSSLAEGVEWDAHSDEDKKDLEKLRRKSAFELSEKELAPDEEEDLLGGMMTRFIDAQKYKKKGFDPEIVGIRVYIDGYEWTRGTLEGTYEYNSQDGVNAKRNYRVNVDKPHYTMDHLLLEGNLLRSEETGELLFKE